MLAKSNRLIFFLLDIGVGRFPVKSLAEAQNAVDKILDYHDEESLVLEVRYDVRWR